MDQYISPKISKRERKNKREKDIAARGRKKKRQRTTMVSHRSLAAGCTRASHSFGFSPMARRRLTRPVVGGGRTPARIASSMRRLKRRRRINDRRIIADDTNNNKNSVARNVNLSHSEQKCHHHPPPPPPQHAQKNDWESKQQLSKDNGFQVWRNGARTGRETRMALRHHRRMD